MKISTKARYALRFMIDIAANGNDNYIPISDVSKRQNISIKYLEQIVSTLNGAGFLISTRGAQGGYKLSKPAKDYLVGDIIRATEGELLPIFCFQDNKTKCDRFSNCATIDFWSELNKVVNDFVDTYTLEDLVLSSSKNEILDFYI